ncbi:serine hydrolase domain-containing protein [Christiangramia sabulilitoris]|uniref:Serine hydrolase n=1 Tax=Christiangramia sabulilitoris TaxID=2583991 RepID=A0A550I0K7_9FLAO|nr:serine hydrolase [Christiangramia sabulilitoris]TRO64517.1 serine hydrolase [Christiangramia sabulilitoris]
MKNSSAFAFKIIILINIFCLSNIFAQDDFKFEEVKPETVNFSSSRLDSLGDFLEQAGSSSLIILKDGKLLYEWGNTEKKHTIHSIRKALLNSLYGIYIAKGTIDTSMTLKQLQIDDIAPSLSEIEKTATVADLLRSRSGVYHSSAATNEAMLAQMPERGTFKPNEQYVYNNWDFNVLGYILEKATGKSVYDLFYEEIAKPLGMQYANEFVSINAEQDSIPQTDGFYQYAPAKSKYPAYHFRLSARDMALYGQLYLNNGMWNGHTIIPEEWIELSTKPHSVYNPAYGIAYGMLWNVLMPTETRKSKSFYHTGVGIHMLGVYPASGIVLIHRVDSENEYNFNQGDFYKMISLVWNAELKEQQL